jgi:uncharacterized membrane protein
MGTKKYWFPAKKYGWGRGLPCCWQGWMLMAIWLACLIAGTTLLVRSITLFVVYTIVLGIGLFIIVFIKGERPGWRWGKD